MKRKSILIVIAAAALLAAPAKAQPYSVNKGGRPNNIASAYSIGIQHILPAGLSIKSLLIQEITSAWQQSGHIEQLSSGSQTETTTYTVVKGDCLFNIAAKYGVPVAAIIQHTPDITNPSLLCIGQVLNIPRISCDTYRVEKGDTLAKISKRLGIDLDDILQANRGIDSNVIDVGTYIMLPSDDNAAIDQPAQAAETPSPKPAGQEDIDYPQGGRLDGAQSAGQATEAPAQTPEASEAPLPSSTPQPITDVAADEDGERPIIDEAEASRMEYEVFELLNYERQWNDLNRVSYDETLADLARQKSQNMADNGYLSHTSPQLGSPYKMLRDNGIQYTAASENIARGQKSAAEVVAAWLNSTGHREVMLNPSFQSIGVGFAQDDNGRSYWTLLFIS